MVLPSDGAKASRTSSFDAARFLVDPFPLREEDFPSSHVFGFHPADEVFRGRSCLLLFGGSALVIDSLAIILDFSSLLGKAGFLPAYLPLLLATALASFHAERMGLFSCTRWTRFGHSGRRRSSSFPDRGCSFFEGFPQHSYSLAYSLAARMLSGGFPYPR